ncbi:hypothetical protein [Frigoribacterium sp. CG_9.8]|nr:hypothetical protein [Frigoribacterium sp. CG_9.8]MBG6106978.1 hypothetical protein [Frigoribacterium sp. CG_9.8]
MTSTAKLAKSTTKATIRTVLSSNEVLSIGGLLLAEFVRKADIDPFAQR